MYILITLSINQTCPFRIFPPYYMLFCSICQQTSLACDLITSHKNHVISIYYVCHNIHSYYTYMLSFLVMKYTLAKVPNLACLQSSLLVDGFMQFIPDILWEQYSNAASSTAALCSNIQDVCCKSVAVDACVVCNTITDGSIWWQLLYNIYSDCRQITCQWQYCKQHLQIVHMININDVNVAVMLLL